MEIIWKKLESNLKVNRKVIKIVWKATGRILESNWEAIRKQFESNWEGKLSELSKQSGNNWKAFYKVKGEEFIINEN